MIAAGVVAFLLLVSLVVILLTGHPGSDNKIKPPFISIPGDNSNTGLLVKEKVFEKEQTVSTEGGIILVDNKDSLINGLEIDIAKDSLDHAAAFSISYSEIMSHGFHSQLHFITPLIHVENNVGYTNDAMLLKVPCQVPEDVIPVAFYYHEDDKSLEYIPVMDFDSSSVTVGLRHFSSGGIGYFTKSFIEETEVIDTGFSPGTDDFSFVNIGSSITPRGNCFGESIAAIWYYKNLKPSQGNLYGKYDNYTNNSSINFATKNFQHDDVLAYRLASMSQLLFVVSPETNQIDWSISRWNAMRTSDQMRYDTLVALMKFSGPQVLLIQRLDSDKICRNYHAIIAYKTVDNRIYVADPNHPGKMDRFIEIENGEFKTYNSADNARDIEAGRSVDYNVFSAFGETAMFDYDKMEELWKQLETGVVGDGKFPEVDVKLIAKLRNAEGEEESQEIDADFRLPGENLTFTVELSEDTGQSVYYTDGVEEPKRIKPVNGRYTIELDNEKEQEIYIGVLIAKENNWHDFEWFPIGFSDVSGIYNVTGTTQMTWYSAGVADVFEKDSLTPFQAQVELKGSDMTIAFSDSSNTVLTGSYDKTTGEFRGMDYSEIADPLGAPVWKLKETIIQFDTESDPITALGVTDKRDLEEEADTDSIIVDIMTELEMIKISD